MCNFANYELMETFEYKPYIDGYPVFKLELWYTGGIDHYGKSKVAYKFFQDDELIFSGDDFYPSPLYAVDSKESANALLGFLSLQPGDTDNEYFENYTERQMQFALEHGEALSIFCYDDEE